MISKLKKSLSRRFTAIAIIVLVLILTGGLLINILTQQVQDEYFREKEELNSKKEVIESIEEHLQLMLFHGRGFASIQNMKEYQAIFQERDKLLYEIVQLEQHNLSREEQELIIELHSFVDHYINNVIPIVRQHVEADNYEGIREIAENGTTALINQTMGLMGSFVHQYKKELNQLEAQFLTKMHQINWVFFGYILFVILLISIAVRKIVKDIGLPLHQLSVVSEDVSAGREVTFVQSDRLDEIGTLSRSFESMVRNIQAKEEELTAQNEELLAQQEVLSDQQNQLKELLADTQASEKKLDLYHRFVSSLTGTLDKDVLLKMIVTELDKLFNTDKSMFVLMNSRYDFYSIGVSQQGAEQFIRHIDQGVAVRLKETKEIHPSKRSIAPSEDSYHHHNGFSYDLYVPVLSSEGELLAIYIVTKVGYEFTQKDQEDFISLMSQAALSIEKLKMFEAVERNQKLNQDIIDNVNEGIQLVDKNGKLLQVNQKLCEIFQCSAEGKHVLSKPLEDWTSSLFHVVNKEKELIEFVKMSLVNQTLENKVIRYMINEPKQKVIEMYAEPIYRNQEKIGTLFVHRDITVEHEIDVMKSELVSTVSHELRTPLASVLGFTELMVTKDLKPERQKKYLQTIHKEAKRLTNLINDFLDLQRMESGKQTYEKQLFDMVQLVNNVASVFQEQHSSRKFIIEEEEKTLMIYADEEKVIQLFTNLISNAVKFSPEGGNVEVRFRNDYEHIYIDVKDYGLGISQSEINNLFQKFYRVDNTISRKIGGTGLGLAISKEIANAHGGDITVQSVEGEGSTFTVSFPLYQCELPRQEFHKIQENNKPLIVILEDDNSLALLLKEQLEETGFAVVHVKDGQEAVQFITKEKPELVVIDIMLEHSIDGWAVIQAMKDKRDTENIPIIISSALDEKEKGISLGVEHYLTKPYLPNELSTVILKTIIQGKKEGQILFPKNSKD
ncbi:ATP-binding protein [Alkalihalobacterium sp. APHAB7]|uniref:ATP-binding protein n=1 Tax=Alkalihalobacterium sp. APHAB7 TaxID=3402081 RepID=UPI003AAE75F5